MKTLHIAPEHSSAGSLLQAIRDSGRDEEVLRFRDDLSCGPIDPYEPEVRAAWWGPYYDALEVEAAHRAFWDHVATTDDQLVVWFMLDVALPLVNCEVLGRYDPGDIAP
jgi:hypothetical protein